MPSTCPSADYIPWKGLEDTVFVLVINFLVRRHSYFFLAVLHLRCIKGFSLVAANRGYSLAAEHRPRAHGLQ